jgi:tetratricopeptide (TPR) repeat protein
MALGACFDYTDDVRISALLAKIVRDEAECDDVRKGAYFGLLRVRRSATTLHPSTATKLTDIRNEVDWRFVDESLNELRRAVPGDRWAAIAPPATESVRAQLELYSRGVAALDFGNHRKSVEFLSELLRQGPNIAALIARARALIGLGRVDDAIADLSQAFALSPASAKVLRERARAYRLKGAIDLANQDEQAAAQIEGR